MKKSGFTRILIFLIMAVTLTVLFAVFPVQGYVTRVIKYVEGMGHWGVIIYGAIYIFACVAFIPGSIMTLGAGFLFGIVNGSITISIASTSGAALAFLIGRTVARGWVESKARANPKFNAIDTAVRKNGIKIVLLTRLSPVFPFTLLNYLFGVTRIAFWEYVLASWIGMLPGTIMYIYFGSAVKNLTDLVGGGPNGGPMRFISLVVGLLATVAVTIYITRIAKKALRSVDSSLSESQQDISESRIQESEVRM